ncbi:MAG: alkaline phosphatase family protein [Vicinamibacterales bacterium]
MTIVVVDQMRADYIDRYQHQWQHGLKRLLANGAWYRVAEYPYAGTVTCPGHATIATGTLPATHGMILNTWFDRAAQAEVTCTADPHVTNISYGRRVASGDSAANLRATTLADELRAQLDPPGRSVAVSLKARAAIMLAGRAPSAVAWFDEAGAWVTSSAFASAPLPTLQAWFAAHSFEQDAGRRWEPALSPGAYLFGRSVAGVSPPAGMTQVFPHALSDDGAIDLRFYERWQTSPFADEYVSQLALDVARAQGLGSGPSTSLLSVSFSALDKVGHQYGPHSHEVQDVLIRLDRTLGGLLDALDAMAGSGHHVVALVGDHGVAPIPEQARESALDAGRVDAKQLIAVCERALSAVLGPGPHVARLVGSDLYLTGASSTRLASTPSAVDALRSAVAELPGIAGLFTAEELERTPAWDSSLRGRFARSHFPGRSGDVTFLVRPYWQIAPTGTTHGSPYAYDARVPLMLMGQGIAAGQYGVPASPVDLAPTLAYLAGVTLPRTDGRVLREALAPAAPLRDSR